MTERIDRSEVCTLASVRRVASMLDLNPDGIAEGELLPRGWHFFLFGGDTQRSKLRFDGFPGFGVPMPDMGMPRLLIAGRTVRYDGDIGIGSALVRSSFIDNIEQKTSSAGPMAFVTIRHELRLPGSSSPSIAERQSFVLLSGERRGSGKQIAPSIEEVVEHRRTVTPDDTMLFQYSALGFNTHKIHIDRAFSRDVEGLPDLVVNGGLTTLLLSEFLRRDLQVTARSLEAKYLAPLYANQPVTLSAKLDGERWVLKAHNRAGVLAATVEVEAQ